MLPLLCGGSAHADEGVEYKIEATFIYNFVKVIQWPADKAINKSFNIDICVIGDSPLMQASKLFEVGSTSTLALALVQDDNPAHAAQHCHIVFIPAAKSGQLADILSSFKNQPVLTVSDMNDFIDRGGMIGFTLVDNKVKLMINAKAATAAGLHIDAQLLEIALKVIN